jgi:hypothetical protein
MYGGGFATIPAYLRDMFGTVQVGAIHGRLLTAWSVAGVLGPVLVNYIREYEIAHGVAKADAYTTTMHIMAALLVLGFLCNFLVRPVNTRYTSEFEAAKGQTTAELRAMPAPAEGQGAASPVKLGLAWTLVGVPLAWGVLQVFKKSLDLFH